MLAGGSELLKEKNVPVLLFSTANSHTNVGTNPVHCG